MSEKKKTKDKVKKKQPTARNVSATGIEFDGFIVRAVTLARDGKGRLRLQGYTKREVLLPEDELDVDARVVRFSDALKGLMSEHKVKNRGTFVTSLPRHVVATRNIRLPSQQEAEIEEMLNYDVERHVPIPSAELKLGFEVLERPDELHSQVLLFAAPKKDLDIHIRIFERAGVNIDQIYVDVLAMVQAFREQSKGKPLLCLLNLGIEMANLVIVKEGKLYFSRCIPAGEERLKEFIGDETLDLDEQLFNFAHQDDRVSRIQTEWLNVLAPEMFRAIQAFQNEIFGEKIDQLYLIGPMASWPGLATRLGEILNITVEEAVPLQGVQLAHNALEGKGSPSEYATAIGLALCGLDGVSKRLNLLPESVVEKRAHVESSRFSRNVGSLVLMAILLFAATIGIKWNERHSKEASLVAIEKKLEPRVNQLKEVTKELEALNQYADRDHSAVKVLKNLYEILPEKVSLVKFTFAKKQQIDMTIRTFTDAERDQVITILKDSTHLRPAQFQASKPHEMAGVKLVESDITCKLVSYSRKTTGPRSGSSGSSTVPK